VKPPHDFIGALVKDIVFISYFSLHTAIKKEDKYAGSQSANGSTKTNKIVFFINSLTPSYKK
jgi:hypothetical protein